MHKAAFLITDGQNGFNTHNVRGMGRVKAQRLYYNVLVSRLRGNSDFYDMARQMLAEAKGLRGTGFFTNAAVCTVIEAFAAVELGPADRDCNGLEDSVDDTDGDGDGVPNAYNDPAGTPWGNCRTVRNINQGELDGDGFGDADGDYVANALDNCPRNYNPDQSDIDRDRVGDVCDLDAENDLMCNIGGPRASGLGLVAGRLFPRRRQHWRSCFRRLRRVRHIAIGVRVVDSMGFVVAKSLTFGAVQTLKFKAPPFAGVSLRAPGAAREGADATPAFTPAADDTRYYLEIAPADGVDTSQAYDVQIATTTVVVGGVDAVTSRTFLPILLK